MNAIPKRILIIAIFIIIFSFYGLVTSVMAFLNGSFITMDSAIPKELTLGLNIVGSLVSIACAVGFFKGIKKARTFYAIYMGITTVMGAISIITMTLPENLSEDVSIALIKSISLGSLLVMVIVPILILFSTKSNQYFTKKNIVQQNLEAAGAKVEEEQVE